MACFCGSGAAAVFSPGDDDITTGEHGQAIAAQRSEICAFNTMLGAVEVLTEELAAAAAKFSAAPGRFAAQLEQSCGEGVPGPWGQVMMQLAAQLALCAEGLRGGERHLHHLRYLLEQSRAQSEAVEEAARTRDEAWLPKVAAERGAAVLSRHSGPTLLRHQRKARLEAQHAARAEFSQRHAEATKVADAMIGRRWDITGAMLWEICQFFNVLFQDAPRYRGGFTDVSNRLVPPVSTESQMVPKDSVIASMALNGVKDWVEKANSQAMPVVAALRLPARRPPSAQPTTPRAPPPLQAPEQAPSLAASAPGRLEGLAAFSATPSPRRWAQLRIEGTCCEAVPVMASPMPAVPATKERTTSIESLAEQMGLTLQAWLGGVATGPAAAPALH